MELPEASGEMLSGQAGDDSQSQCRELQTRPWGESCPDHSAEPQMALGRVENSSPKAKPICSRHSVKSTPDRNVFI